MKGMCEFSVFSPCFLLVVCVSAVSHSNAVLVNITGIELNETIFDSIEHLQNEQIKLINADLEGSVNCLLTTRKLKIEILDMKSTHYF